MEECTAWLEKAIYKERMQKVELSFSLLMFADYAAIVCGVNEIKLIINKTSFFSGHNRQ
jgi:hypothetical protein